MSRRPLVFLSVLAFVSLSACGDDGAMSGVDAVDTSGLDGLPEPDGADAPTPDTDASSDTEPAETSAPDTEPADTGTGETSSPDTEPQDAADTAPLDTGSEDTGETSSPDTASADTADTVADTTVDTDTSGPLCECLEVGPGELGVVITNDGTSEPPTLGGLSMGADPMSGLFDLDAITVYTKGAFDGVIIQSATVANDGLTSGTVRFEGGHWAFLLDLDLLFIAQTALGVNSGGSRTLIEGGGCHELNGNLIVGDTSDCANEWPSGTTPPATFEFAYDASGSRFVLKVELTRAFVVALVPPEYELIANVAITGPIRFIAVFSPR